MVRSLRPVYYYANPCRLRVVKAQGREILVNGKPTKLRGFNRHDMYPQYVTAARAEWD